MSNNQFNDIFKAFSNQFNTQNVDISKFAEAQKNNIETLTAANKVIVESTQAILRRQSEMAKANIETAIKASKDIFSGKSPETNTAKQAELAKDIYTESVSNAKEISDMAAKSSAEVFELLNKRATEAFTEVSKTAA